MPGESASGFGGSVAQPQYQKKYAFAARGLYRKWSPLEFLPPFYAFFDLYVSLFEGRRFRFGEAAPALPGASAEEGRSREAYERQIRKLVTEPSVAAMARTVGQEAGRREARATLALRLLLLHLSRGNGEVPPSAALTQLLTGPVFNDLDLQMVQNESLFPARDSIEALWSVKAVFDGLPAWETPFEVPTPEADEPAFEKKGTSLPLGGYSELTNTGSLESIVPTELAYMTLTEDYFRHKMVNRHLLYYGRDTESELRVLKKTLVVGAWLNSEWGGLPYSIGRRGALGRRVVAGVLLRTAVDSERNSRGKLRARVFLLGKDSERDVPLITVLQNASPKPAVTAGALPACPIPILGIEDPLATCPLETKHTARSWMCACLLCGEPDAGSAEEFARKYYDHWSLITLTDEKLESPGLLHKEMMQAVISLTS